MSWAGLLLAKRLLQDLWRLELSCDQELNNWDGESRQKNFISSVIMPSPGTWAPSTWSAWVCRCIFQGMRGSSIPQNSVSWLHYPSVLSCSKAPLKTQNISRLELCGALLLIYLLAQVAADLTISPAAVYAWTDSAVVLEWLTTSFVVHTDINSNILLDQWRYIQTKSCRSNVSGSADCLEKWKEQAWLSSPPSTWSKRPDLNSQDLPGIKLIIENLNPYSSGGVHHMGEWSELLLGSWDSCSVSNSRSGKYQHIWLQKSSRLRRLYSIRFAAPLTG